MTTKLPPQAKGSLEHLIEVIGQLAENAASQGYFGLQDLNLLLSEVLHEQSNESPLDTDEGLLSRLNAWPALVDNYCNGMAQSAEALIHCLRYPALSMPLGDDEFAMLQDQLISENPTLGLALELADADETTGGEDSIPGAVSPAAQELVNLLLIQSGQVRSNLEAITIDDKESLLNGLQGACEELERLANVSKTAGFEGLAIISEHVVFNIQEFIGQIGSFTLARHRLLLDWIAQVQEYLPVFNESSSGQLIVASLTDDEWAVPMCPEDLITILLQIRSESALVDEQAGPNRMEVATDDDVSLELPGDVNHELLELLLQELPIYTQQFSEAIQRILAGGGQQDLELAQRVAHTLKGSANTVGIKGIAVLTHQLEDILLACANEHKLPSRGLANSLIAASDCLENMSEALLNGRPAPNDAKAVLQDVLNWANRIDKTGLPDADSEEGTSEQPVELSEQAPSNDAASASQAQSSMVRVSHEQLEDLFRLSGESIILNSQASESMRRMKKQLQAMKVQFTLLQELGAELEQLIDLKDLTGRSFAAVESGFDALEMDQYNELHSASRRMAEAAIDAREISLDVSKDLDRVNEILEFQQRMVVDAQEVVMQTRLVSVSTIAPRLQRSLRQTCRMTGKECNLTLLGDNILIDGDILNALVDPMMHILRNAVDHGIESAAERTVQGKPTTGNLSFTFDRQGNNILVRCQDDGRGLDYGAIRAAAESRGLLKPGQSVTEEELKALILRPNFSSRTTSTQTSGRGVGMDVVRAQIINMGGTLNLQSRQGQGMTIELRVPLPLSMTYALLTYVGRYQVAIANKGILQIIYSAEGEVVHTGDKEVLVMDGVTYPAVRLIDLLHIPDHRKVPRPYSAILLVQGENQETAVLIDAIYDSVNAVIKGMGKYLGKIPGFIGATILGDGTIIPVLDIPELIRVPTRKNAGEFAVQMVEDEPSARLPTILVVDDSLSQRRALEQLLSDAGYRVRTARDGIEATEILANFRPDVILTDLEMPRMNGIELTSYIRNHASIKAIPVIMITSRTTQKHRKMAEDAGVDSYITKPVREESLLGEMQALMELAAESANRTNKVANWDIGTNVA
jgi:chemotaxis protein histidine kinase CheA/AmiR/NasT family two-component response regulator